MSLPLPVLPLRVLASRAVLAHGFDSRQLQELPYPLDREMDSYGKLQGTFRMKSKNVKIEKVAAPLTVDSAAAKVNRAIARHPFSSILSVGRDIVVKRHNKEEWSVKTGAQVARFKFSNLEILPYADDRYLCKGSCYPVDGGLVKYCSSTRSTLQSVNMKLDRGGSLVYIWKYTFKLMTATWTCRANRLRRSLRKQE